MTPESRDSPLLDNELANTRSMEMRIRGGRLGTERVSVSTESTIATDTRKK
jgi:hypothetical protein